VIRTILLVGLLSLSSSLGVAFGAASPIKPGAVTAAHAEGPRVTSPVSINSFSFNPSTLSSGTQTSLSATISGGTTPYYLWFNNTPSGCSPMSVPEMVSSGNVQFNCNPTSTGSYMVQLAVLDSSTPRSHANANASLSVTSNSGNNNNGNNNSGSNSGNSKGNGSLSLPSGLLQLGIIFGAVFLVSMLLIAAGTIATAVLVSRRLRQINETLAKANAPSKDPKPPA
jgi:hypothetical protein